MDGLWGKAVCRGRWATNCTFCPAELYQNAVGSTSCKLCAVGSYQDAAEQTECKVCDVVNVSHLYEYLAVTENHVTDDFALAGARACCACGTRRDNSEANSSTVYVDHSTYGAGNYTIVPGNIRNDEPDDFGGYEQHANHIADICDRDHRNELGHVHPDQLAGRARHQHRGAHRELQRHQHHGHADGHPHGDLFGHRAADIDAEHQRLVLGDHH